METYEKELLVTIFSGKKGSFVLSTSESANEALAILGQEENDSLRAEMEYFLTHLSEEKPDIPCEFCGGKHFTQDEVGDCMADAMFDAMVPSDIQQEHYENTHPHRYLPSGDLEFADEFGGY